METTKEEVDECINKLLEVRGGKPGKLVQLTEAEVRKAGAIDGGGGEEELYECSDRVELHVVLRVKRDYANST
jgi:hypothetical protein